MTTFHSLTAHVTDCCPTFYPFIQTYSKYIDYTVCNFLPEESLFGSLFLINHYTGVFAGTDPFNTLNVPNPSFLSYLQ